MRPFGLTKELSKSFSKPVMEYLPDFFDPEEVFDAEYEDLESLAQLASPEIVKERIQKLGVNLTADELKERVLYNDGTRVVVAGLRFRNLDLSFPFVALKLNFRADQDGAVQTLNKLVRENFSLAAPRGFTFWEKPEQTLGQSAIWSSVYAGAFETLSLETGKESNLPPGFEIRFDSTFAPPFDLYLESFEQWRRQSPELAAYVSPESKDDLETAASKGLLATLYKDGKWCGVVAAKSSPLFGKRGLYLIELFLTADVRGQGLGQKLQSQFLSRHRDQFELIWGHIHSQNFSARNTAVGLGRTNIQQEYFFSLDV